MAQIHDFFDALLEFKGSDLHLSTGNPPIIRINGELETLDYPPFDDATLREMLYEICPGDKVADFQESGDIDFGYGYGDKARFRANYFRQNKGIAGASGQFRLKSLARINSACPMSVASLPVSRRDWSS